METEVLQIAVESICASAHADSITLFVSTRKKGNSKKGRGDPEVLVAAGGHIVNGDKATSIVKQQYELASKSATLLDPTFISHLPEYTVLPERTISSNNSNSDLTFR